MPQRFWSGLVTTALGSDLGKLEKVEKVEKNSQGRSPLSQGRIFLKVAPQT